MRVIDHLPAGTYIVAVSGGVDSVALLDIICRRPDLSLVVAHFDHGIRSDSRQDEQFVAKLAEQYHLPYETERVELGPGASEAAARQARYDFLFRTRDKHEAQSIITAHHADDVIETMMINLIRGTGWRGLCSLQDTQKIRRPFLRLSKAEIIAHAKIHNLSWREDATNTDEQYLRNAVRRQLMPKADRQKWLNLYNQQKKLVQQINREAAQLDPYKRYDYIMWPRSVALEMVKTDLKLTRRQADYALTAIKTAAHGAVLEVGANKKLTFTRDSFIVSPLQA